MKIVVVAVAILAATTGFASPHPGNARAAAACSALFFYDGNFDEATFFSKLANEEASLAPEALLARARVDMHEGHGSFVQVFRRELVREPASGEVFLRGAAELVEHGNLRDAEKAVSIAIEADPSLERMSTSWLEFVKRSHPAQSVAPPLPPPARPADADAREARCRALEPPLFPEPFDGHSVGRIVEEPISQPGGYTALDTLRPCVRNVAWDIVVGIDGRVESITSIRASFKGSGQSDPAAVAAVGKYFVPVVMRWTYKPGSIRGVPVRTVTRWGSGGNCK